MDVESQHQQILKIAIGSAWADRHLEPGEVDYLQTLFQRYHLSLNSEMQSLLETPVPLEQTERWIVAYLSNTTETERLKLLAAIGNVLIADNNVSDADHDLLDEYHTLMAAIPPHPEATSTVVRTLGQYARKVIRSVREFVSGPQ
ncbi:hypothetical protein AVDCRST_MAG81-122 [uncultured Synechococcales cyanobacterium]|uniref:TerB family tellurite resistance protein n=1 Tax=uncultured Synechococcales cyanobacterium TaxID=1936017 RepID=A0A6J4UM99_9CYAN|nr:hypothetical protein AVDCRST_MAG81-122 [uncultured Synechococcales cyanobacterium]